MFATIKNGIKTAAVIALAIDCGLLISGFGIDNENVIMVFLLSVLFTAVLTSSREWAIAAALISAMLFNYLFTQPRYSFLIYDTNDLMLLLFFVVTGMVSGTVASRLQQEMKLASESERTTKIMYSIASDFLSASGKDSVIKKATKLVGEYAGLDSEIYLDANIAKQGYAIRSRFGTLGTLVVHGGKPDRQQYLIIQAVCTQLGIALERESLVADREKIRIAMEREQQRGMFLRSIAHDLRSPLTALSGAGNLLADNYDRLTDIERRKLASDISEEIVWLTDLVENILNMTRINEQKLALHKQDEVIDDVIGEAVKHTERLLHGRRVQVKLPDEVVAVPMDGKLIAQVIINLLENAARHTPENSEITLAAKAKENLTVSIADTGDGVPEAVRGNLFERFVTQDEDVVDGRRGLGLGLAICKAIIEAHGGTIYLEDNAPKGSIFTFTLPMEDVQ